MKSVMIYQKDVSAFSYEERANKLVLKRKMTPEYVNNVTLYASQDNQLFQVSDSMPPLSQEMQIKLNNIYREKTCFLQLLNVLTSKQADVKAITFEFDDDMVEEFGEDYADSQFNIHHYDPNSDYKEKINRTLTELSDEPFLLNNLKSIDVRFKHVPINARYYPSGVIYIQQFGKSNEMSHKRLLKLTMAMIDPTLTFRHVSVEPLGKVPHPLSTLGELLTYLNKTDLPEPAKTAYQQAQTQLAKLAKKHKDQMIYEK